MASNHADFTRTFRELCEAAASPEGDAKVSALFANPDAYDSWAVRWRERLKREHISGEERAERMRTSSPAFIPRNHLVEIALHAAVAEEDFLPFEELVNVMSRPYEDRPEWVRYATPARPEQCVSQTFCGT
jgi:uncharacterized protein YdiU (UPF0061 family)